MIHLDGFTLTHVIEPIIFPEQSDVDRFLPPNNFPLPLKPDKPVAMGDFGPPFIYTEAKWAHERVMRDAKGVIKEVWDEYARAFGRQSRPVEKHHSDGAKIILMTMGSIGETASVAVDQMRQAGRGVGLIKLRLWRPFPFEELREAVKDADILIVLDRDLSFGGPGGVLASEVKAAFYNQAGRLKVVSFVGSLGGRDITTAGFEDIVNKAEEIAAKGTKNEYEIYGVRE